VSVEPLTALSSNERAALLRLARRAILARVGHQPPSPTLDLPARLSVAQGAFVTLHIRGDLRGCIGMVEVDRPLGEVVARCAAGAATEDPRFPPLAIEEMGDLRIEISALSHPVVIDSPDQVETGRHGVIVSQGRQQGLLLPQIAVEQGWDRETLLRQTCRKAGLPPDAYEHGARLQIFEADVFSEQASSAAPPSSRFAIPPRRR
jgi:AmmeMemoRadiSam system protein A